MMSQFGLNGHAQLRPAYKTDDGTNRYCRRLLALPLLPHEHITCQFNTLQSEATTEKLHDLCQYMVDTWITGAAWPPSSWSVFMEPIRTNNNCEGWHRRLHHKAKKTQLINVLFQEAQHVTLQISLLSQDKLKRQQKKKYRDLQAKIFTFWDDFNNHVV